MQRALLVLLLLHLNEVVSSDHLIDSLWNANPPATARKVLTVYISQLRKALANGHVRGDEVIATRRPGYVLQIPTERLDSARFRRLVQDARRERATNPGSAVATFREALALWRGAPLVDVMYEPFARIEIDSLEELRVAALEERLEAEMQLGAHAEVIAELQALVAQHPFRERFHALLMRALYRSGRQRQALDVYAAVHEQRLDEGLDPWPQLRELQVQILNQDPRLELSAPDLFVANGASTPDVAEPARQPEPEPHPTVLRPPMFIDAVERGTTLRKLSDAIAAAPVVAVEGLPGAGKTYLLASHSARADTRMLWYHVDHGATLDDLLTQVPTGAPSEARSYARRCAGLVETLRSSGRILILDDIQHADTGGFDVLIDTAAAQPAPAALVILSRTKVDTAHGVSTVARVRLEGLETNEAQALLEGRGVQLPLDEVEDLCAKTNGLPLAISVFSTLVVEYGWDPRELLAGTMLTSQRLKGWYHEVLSQVNESARTLARFLSVSDGPFNVGLTRQVRRLHTDVDSDHALNELLRAYIVRPYSPHRWSMHELVSRLISESLTPDERQSLQRTHAEHYSRQLDRRRPIDMAEIPFLARACRHFIAAGDRARATEVVSAIAPAAKQHGQYRTLQQLAEAIIAAFPDHDRWIDYHAAHAVFILGEVDATTRILESLLRNTDDRHTTLSLSAHRLYADCLAARGQIASALQIVLESLDEASGAHETAIANAKATAVNLYLRLGETTAATTTAQELLASAARRGDRRGGAVAHAQLARCSLATSDLGSAIRHGHESVRLFREVGDQRGIGWGTGILCQALLMQDDPDIDTATALATESIRTRRDSGECSHDYSTFLDHVRARLESKELEPLLESEQVRLKRWAEEAAHGQ